MYASRIVVISKEEKRNILQQMFSRRITTAIATRSRQYGLRTQSHPYSAAVTIQQDEPLISDLAASYINLEEKYGAHNYHPLPVVLSKGEGMYVFLSNAYNAYDVHIFSCIYVSKRSLYITSYSSNK